MTLREFEQRLQQCNPRLHIKTYGESKAGIHLGTRYICRVGPGEIMPHNQFYMEIGQNDAYISDFNPKGYYKFRRLVERGRAETARILYTQRLISFADVSKLSN